MNNNNGIKIIPATSYPPTGRTLTLRVISSLGLKFEKRWNKIDETGNIFELEGHNEDTLCLGPISEFDYGTYFCEVRVDGEDFFFKTGSAKVLPPETRTDSLGQRHGVSLSISTRGSRLPSNTSSSNSPTVSPRHPYYRGSVSKQRPSSVTLTTSLNQSMCTPDLARESEQDSDESSSSYLAQEETPRHRPSRTFRRESNLSSEPDVFQEMSHLTSTPLGCPDTPDWSLGSSGYAMASPSLICSVSSSLPSPVSQLRNTFYEMAALPRRCSLSRLSLPSENIPRHRFKNEHDHRLAGYQLDRPNTSFIGKPRFQSNFRFSLRSTSEYSENNK
eukprot:TRINITY_DN8107_c0_g1_i1.p1 TRINITY_DN8107_c0_g1~~TRINITY_DN8107_c0_g1_i1.p1  ORF type:complete len:332 (-),score=66.44 TRINITY_DN8107_c0_g1_i1:71-1066(-)